MDAFKVHKRGCRRCRQNALCGQGRAILARLWDVMVNPATPTS